MTHLSKSNPRTSTAVSSVASSMPFSGLSSLGRRSKASSSVQQYYGDSGTGSGRGVSGCVTNLVTTPVTSIVTPITTCHIAKGHSNNDRSPLFSSMLYPRRPNSESNSEVDSRKKSGLSRSVEDVLVAGPSLTSERGMSVPPVVYPVKSELRTGISTLPHSHNQGTIDASSVISVQPSNPDRDMGTSTPGPTVGPGGYGLIIGPSPSNLEISPGFGIGTSTAASKLICRPSGLFAPPIILEVDGSRAGSLTRECRFGGFFRQVCI